MITSKQVVKFLKIPYNKIINFNILYPCSFDNLCDLAITFLKSEDVKKLNSLKSCSSNILVILPEKLKKYCNDLNQMCLFSKNPRLDFTRILKKFFVQADEITIYNKTVSNTKKIDSTTLINNKAKIHPSVIIGPYCVIDECEIGEGSKIHSSVHIFKNVEIDKNVEIHSNCTIGTHGFGFVKTENGKWDKIPHIGGVKISDNVEIFAQTNVDRGTLNNTFIGKGVKIDHKCHIGHNVKIKENSIITACTIIGGSTEIGKNVWVGPNSSIMNNIKIGDNVFIGMASNVLKSVEKDVIVAGNPAKIIKNNKK
ncbi:MAG: UDP-3-O-(3-hydroxymyristoyl)glucosamine N-acyltransferase [Armatimonadetes bacterium]|nr:UDP-3-O-(3-hydroxymyristoyl)glucosamine N-acyltransferase [Armatimonadota bacterium]